MYEAVVDAAARAVLRDPNLRHDFSRAGRIIMAVSATSPRRPQNLLGLLLQQRGDLGEAETWYRTAADADDSRAMNNLGLLLQQRGDLGEAETWWRRAVEAGDSDAMRNLGLLAEDSTETETE